MHRSRVEWSFATSLTLTKTTRACLAEIARSETETLRERINSGLAEARRKGVKLGRPKGTGYDTARLLELHKDVVRALKAGQSIRNAAKITGTGGSTVQRVAAAMKALV